MAAPTLMTTPRVRVQPLESSPRNISHRSHFGTTHCVQALLFGHSSWPQLFVCGHCSCKQIGNVIVYDSLQRDDWQVPLVLALSPRLACFRLISPLLQLASLNTACFVPRKKAPHFFIGANPSQLPRTLPTLCQLRSRPRRVPHSGSMLASRTHFFCI